MNTLELMYNSGVRICFFCSKFQLLLTCMYIAERLKVLIKYLTRIVNSVWVSVCMCARVGACAQYLIFAKSSETEECTIF